MSHVMLDIETLDVKASAVVLAIGAVKFEPGKLVDEPPFYSLLDVDSQIAAGRTVDYGTLCWWMQPETAPAREHLFQMSHVRTGLPSVKNTLTALKRFCENADGVWGNGASFDNVIITNLAQQFGVGTNVGGGLWPFWRDRCFRTLKSEFDPEKRFEPEAKNNHIAVDDALNQAAWAAEILSHFDGLTGD